MYEYYTKCLYKNVLISNTFHEFEKYSVMNLAHIFTLQQILIFKVVIPILGPQKFQTNQYSILLNVTAILV